jgi:hypothetical protein
LLASLASFKFYGVCEYLEDLVAQIDAPQLTFFEITYFNHLDVRVPELLPVHQSRQSCLSIQISCQGLDWQVSSITQLISQSSTMLADVRHLSIDEKDLQPSWRDDIDQDEWVPLLRQFTNARLRSGKPVTILR